MPKHKVAAIALCSILLTQASCGTLLYPERRGQTNGNFDPAVLVLNGIGLLFFLLPGVVAFAVDLNTGTIYLPEGGTNTQPNKPVNIEGKVTADAINAIVEDRLQIRKVLDHPELQVTQTGL